MQTWKSIRNHLESEPTLSHKLTKRTITKLAVRVLLQSKKITDLILLPPQADDGFNLLHWLISPANIFYKCADLALKSYLKRIKQLKSNFKGYKLVNLVNLKWKTKLAFRVSGTIQRVDSHKRKKMKDYNISTFEGLYFLCWSFPLPS